MYIKAYFENDKYLTIKFLHKNSIRRWFEHCKNFQDSYSNYELSSDFGTRKVTSCNLHHRPNEATIIESWNAIKFAISNLENVGYNVPFNLPDNPDFDQPLLNKLHRFFTYNALWVLTESYKHEPNPFDPLFKFPETFSFNSWHDVIDVINNNVHVLEKFLALPKKIKCHSEFYTGVLHFRPSELEAVKLGVRKPLWITFTEDEINELNGPTIDYTDGLAVVLNRSILGKCYLQSFVEDDDPTALDCTGRLGSFGVFNVLTNNNRSKIYESEDFINWTKQYNLDISTLHLDAQIGNVIDTNIQNLNNQPQLNFIRLEFLENI